MCEHQPDEVCWQMRIKGIMGTVDNNTTEGQNSEWEARSVSMLVAGNVWGRRGRNQVMRDLITILRN